jgi:hypothetical protein
VVQEHNTQELHVELAINMNRGSAFNSDSSLACERCISIRSVSAPFAGVVWGFLGVGEGYHHNSQDSPDNQERLDFTPSPTSGASSPESIDLAALQTVCRIGAFLHPNSSALQRESVSCMVGRCCHEAGGRFRKIRNRGVACTNPEATVVLTKQRALPRTEQDWLGPQWGYADWMTIDFEVCSPCFCHI